MLYIFLEKRFSLALLFPPSSAWILDLQDADNTVIYCVAVAMARYTARPGWRRASSTFQCSMQRSKSR